MIPAIDAIRRLREGNERFASGHITNEVLLGRAHRPNFVDGQAPFAIVLGCSDSRAPAELVFDQGLGDLFVIRVAGNVVAPSQVGSVEFAAERYNTRLVVVLGHSQCGAIAATIEDIRTGPHSSNNLRSIVNRIRPSVEGLFETDLVQDEVALTATAVRANVRASTNHLRHGSPLLEKLTQDHGLLVVGAEYSLDTGKVDFFDGVPD